MEKINETKTKGVLTGVAEEYFVAAELTIRGYIASITLRNTKGIDILVSNHDASESIGGQVKTNHGDRRKAWVLNSKAENSFKDNLFYVFVNLKGKNHRPDFYVVPSQIVANYVRETHQNWLETPGRGGRQHQDNSMRMFKDLNNEYLEKWTLIDEKLGISSPAS